MRLQIEQKNLKFKYNILYAEPLVPNRQHFLPSCAIIRYDFMKFTFKIGTKKRVHIICDGKRVTHFIFDFHIPDMLRFWRK